VSTLFTPSHPHARGNYVCKFAHGNSQIYIVFYMYAFLKCFIALNPDATESHPQYFNYKLAMHKMGRFFLDPKAPE